MKYVPHEYQAYATQFILDHPVAAILLQMGLGKSVITLTAIRELFRRGEIRKVLVIAPLRVARDTWPQEIRKWDHLQDLTFSVAVGTADERRRALRSSSQIMMINRENVPWLIESSGIPFEWDMVVIDELSSFKSWQAKRFRSLIRVRPQIRRIVGLTGTPAPNGYMDLFAEYRILDMGQRLGRFITKYREIYFEPERWGNGQVYSWKLRPGAKDEIERKIQDITVSMKSVDYLKMPECVMNTVPVYMDQEESLLYDELKDKLILEILSGKRECAEGGLEGDRKALQLHTIDAKNAAVLSGKLTQMANGAVYSEEGEIVEIHDRKLDALEDLIEGANGNPMLVAYWYQHDVERIRKRFPFVRVLKTAQDMLDWNAGKIAVAAVHPASAGHGLNLQAGGSTIVWFGLTWSLELYQQTNARLWRQGQRAETVVIHHIITEGTIDEDILDALNHKEQSQNRLIDAVKAQINHIQTQCETEGPGRSESPGRTRRCEKSEEGQGDDRKASRKGEAA